MKLVKYTICTNGLEDVIYCANGSKIDDKNCKLLGFHLNRPVFGDNTMKLESDQSATQPPQRVNRVVKDSNTGDKFLFLNGKKLKLVSPSKIPLNVVRGTTVRNLNVIKVNTNTLNNVQLLKETVNVSENKVIPKVDVDKSNNVNIDKISTISGENSLKEDLSQVKQQNPVKAASLPSILPDKSRFLTVGGDNKPYMKLNKMDKMQALDLTKTTAEKEVQTEPVFFIEMEDDLLSGIDLMSSNFLDEIDNLSPSNWMSPKKEQVQKPTKIVPHAAKLFTELRCALQTDDKGNMPIHVGVLTNDLNMVKRSWLILKTLGQSIDLMNNADLTPLQLAVMHDVNQHIISFLLNEGANTNQTDCDGNYIVHLCVHYEYTECLQTILRWRVDVDVFNNEGLTPLMICCQNSYLSCAKLLLEQKANINLRDQISGRTALFHAAERHDVPMVTLLMSYGADTKIKNFFGISPHDAMYEIEDIPKKIKILILGKLWKKRSNDEETTETPVVKKKIIKTTELKTYTRFQKIDKNTDLTKVT